MSGIRSCIPVGLFTGCNRSTVVVLHVALALVGWVFGLVDVWSMSDALN